MCQTFPSKTFYLFVHEETEGRVRVTKVKFMEHGKNAAYYEEN